MYLNYLRILLSDQYSNIDGFIYNLWQLYHINDLQNALRIAYTLDKPNIGVDKNSSVSRIYNKNTNNKIIIDSNPSKPEMQQNPTLRQYLREYQSQRYAKTCPNRTANQTNSNLMNCSYNPMQELSTTMALTGSEKLFQQKVNAIKKVVKEQIVEKTVYNHIVKELQDLFNLFCKQISKSISKSSQLGQLSHKHSTLNILSPPTGQSPTPKKQQTQQKYNQPHMLPERQPQEKTNKLNSPPVIPIYDHTFDQIRTTYALGLTDHNIQISNMGKSKGDLGIHSKGDISYDIDINRESINLNSHKVVNLDKFKTASKNSQTPLSNFHPSKAANQQSIQLQTAQKPIKQPTNSRIFTQTKPSEHSTVSYTSPNPPHSQTLDTHTTSTKNKIQTPNRGRVETQPLHLYQESRIDILTNTEITSAGDMTKRVKTMFDGGNDEEDDDVRSRAINNGVMKSLSRELYIAKIIPACNTQENIQTFKYQSKIYKKQSDKYHNLPPKMPPNTPQTSSNNNKALTESYQAAFNKKTSIENSYQRLDSGPSNPRNSGGEGVALNYGNNDRDREKVTCNINRDVSNYNPYNNSSNYNAKNNSINRKNTIDTDQKSSSNDRSSNYNKNNHDNSSRSNNVEQLQPRQKNIELPMHKRTYTQNSNNTISPQSYPTKVNRISQKYQTNPKLLPTHNPIQEHPHPSTKTPAFPNSPTNRTHHHRHPHNNNMLPPKLSIKYEELDQDQIRRSCTSKSSFTDSKVFYK